MPAFPCLERLYREALGLWPKGESLRPGGVGRLWPGKAEKQRSSSVLVLGVELSVVALALLTAPGASPGLVWRPCVAGP